MTTSAERLKAKRARRPIYMVVRRLVDPATGEEVGALVPAHPIDQRLMKERKFHVNREVRAELKQPRNPAFHRLAHAIGNLLVDNVEKFSGKGGHDALKEVQRESGVCCDTMEIDLGPLGKVPVKQPRSLAFDEMEEDEFAQFFDGITAYIGEHYASVMLDEVRAEFWLMVQGEARAA
jgi:hypothetical protein